MKLARRQSGGGAVFHDLGNTNFTFLSSRADYSKENNNKILCNALRAFGIEAGPSGRNDIIADGKKVSGAAFKEKSDRCFHHGTMLIDVDMNRLGDYLSPSKLKLRAKGVSSVRSRVANLRELSCEISHDSFCDSVIREFYSHYEKEGNPEILDDNSIKRFHP